ncbi:hypothetical protein I2H38_18980, partial [Microvirga sp. BT350]|nr:hypothetical protein [Microvirga alba]
MASSRTLMAAAIAMLALGQAVSIMPEIGVITPALAQAGSTAPRAKLMRIRVSVN